MALINCPECHSTISDKAANCIHCGYPLLSESPTSRTFTPILKKSETAAKEAFDGYPDVVTIAEVCEMLNVCKSTIYQLLRSNKIEHLRIGRKYIIPKKCIVNFLESSPNVSEII